MRVAVSRCTRKTEWTPAALYENAIAAMEDARREPNSELKFHSGTVRLRTLQRSDLEAELNAALQKDDYDLNYLPIVDANTGAPTTIEALLRWPDAVLGSQPTRKIVRVAERTGLILPIGRWVMKTACEQLQVWRAAGHADIRVAVNLSAQELVSEGIVESVEATLSETNTRPADLDIEAERRHPVSRGPVPALLFVIDSSLWACDSSSTTTASERAHWHTCRKAPSTL